MYDLIIRNGLIYDGTGEPAVKGDIAIYACFGKGKMQQLANQLETQYPQRRVVIMAEQDG